MTVLADQPTAVLAALRRLGPAGPAMTVLAVPNIAAREDRPILDPVDQGTMVPAVLLILVPAGRVTMTRAVHAIRGPEVALTVRVFADNSTHALAQLFIGERHRIAYNYRRKLALSKSLKLMTRSAPLRRASRSICFVVLLIGCCSKTR